GRIILDNNTSKVSGSNPGRETLMLCLHGSGTVNVGSESFPMSKFDGLYIARGAAFDVSTESEFDLLETSAETDKSWPTKLVSFARDVQTNESLALKVGKEPYYRDLNKVLCENIEGSRILLGFTMSKPGNWTSWPPHEHAATREELYLFFDMPSPAFATQYIYTNLDNPEFVRPVYENDAVTIVKGYHPNVAAPGYSVNFVWVLCSLEDGKWRTLADVNVQPGYESIPTGLR
ncbi:MAG TPA: 5-deoxy-glucuronate isomerase, partial [Candidatus Kapabacteria bacterium]